MTFRAPGGTATTTAAYVYSTGKRVLLVEDDANLLAALRYNFAQEGYEVLSATDGQRGLALARAETPDVIILDLMLPSMGGLDVCRALRRDGDVVPILMLTARDAEIDRVVGLEIGADDYIVKPFSVRELIARVAATLRRVEMLKVGPAGNGNEQLTFGDLSIDLAGREVTIAGAGVRLRPKEFDLLAFLAGGAGRAFSRDQLLEHVWGYDYSGDSRTVDVHVRWLRQKIEEDPPNPRRIVTVRGVGYRFSA